LSIHKSIGIPLAEGLETALDLPHTLSYAIRYREQLDSFNELPKDKRPPRNLWDKPYELTQFLDRVFKNDDKQKGTEFYDVNDEDLE